MSARRRTPQVVRSGADLVQQRVAAIAGRAAAVLGAVFALGGCAIAAIFGNGPGFVALIVIVLGVALVFGFVVRMVVSRIDVAALAAFVARRAAGRRRF
jgi:hypothetical protein